MIHIPISIDLYSYETLKTIITNALSKTDVIITSGGVSMGEKVCKILE